VRVDWLRVNVSVVRKQVEWARCRIFDSRENRYLRSLRSDNLNGLDGIVRL
jgi:hypothetical protein